MAISEAAQRNHDELFPGRVSTLAQTDPEFIEYFDNFAFDDVLAHDDLARRTRLMVQLASMIACQALGEYRVMLGAALTVGVTPVEVKEIVYQAVPYVGMAKVFDFLHVTNDVLTERGVELPLPGQSTTTPKPDSRRASRCRSRSSATSASTSFTPPRLPTSSTSSGGCQRTASATTSPAGASTSPPANCSPSPCSPPSADANRNWPDTSRRTSTSATTAPCCSTCSPSFSRSSATPAPSTRCGCSTRPRSPGTDKRGPDGTAHLAAVRHLVDRSFARLGRVDAVVSNAGYGLFGAAEELSDEQVEDIIATNLTGSITLIRSALPRLRGQGAGRIIQISSYGGQVAFPGNSLYHATQKSRAMSRFTASAIVGPLRTPLTSAPDIDPDEGEGT